MSTFAQAVMRVRRLGSRPADAAPGPVTDVLQGSDAPPVDIAPNDPLVAYLQSAPHAVDLDGLALESRALDELRAAGVKIVVPLVSHGELIGLINLGPRLSEQGYSGDDLRLLDKLATQAAPSLRVGQLVREQQVEAQSRERMEQELEVARLIQQNYLPKSLPDLPGWQVEAFYRPARAVGGDFYDFIELDDGRVGLVVGDVTDKGVPAALVMSATRSVLRASAQRLTSPGQVLARVNDLLCQDMPPKMFVTCLYGVLDPTDGRLVYANAGHNVPYVSTDDGAIELRARGMPLGLMPGMSYEEKEAVLAPGQSILLHSDGLVEAHSPEHEMFGFPRLMELVGRGGGEDLIDSLLGELDAFTGSDWEQEDDITLVTLRRTTGGSVEMSGEHERTLAEFTALSEPGNERRVIELVTEAVRELELPRARLDRLQTAVGEAVMNAMEHGNGYRSDAEVGVRVVVAGADLLVQIADEGASDAIAPAEAPDLAAKLAGDQTPRGWGLFLIRNMVDELRTRPDDGRHIIELVLHLKGGDDGQPL